MGNPIWEEMRDIALRPGPSFLLNVALNEQREITGVFAGDLLAAHRAGCEFRQESRRCSRSRRRSTWSITTNSGYPLDLNLYQGVKGMSAGARILKPGGTLILACECRDGVPAGSSFDQLLRTATSPEEILARLAFVGLCSTGPVASSDPGTASTQSHGSCLYSSLTGRTGARSSFDSLPRYSVRRLSNCFKSSRMALASASCLRGR